MVAVIDGGFDTAFCDEDYFGNDSPTVRDVVPDDPSSSTPHGTLVTTLIHETCPSARLLVLRILGDAHPKRNGTATEWALFHALKIAPNRCHLPTSDAGALVSSEDRTGCLASLGSGRQEFVPPPASSGHA